MKKRDFNYSIVENNIFRFALIFSVLLHLVLFVKLSAAKWSQRNKKVQTIEVAYYRMMETVKKTEEQTERLKTFKKKLLEPKKEVPPQKKESSPFVKDLTKLMDTFKVPQKKLSETPPEPKKKVSVPALESENMKSPSYLNYYQIIRNKIKERAYANYVKADKGEVYLTFVLLADGKLQQINVLEDRTSANPYIREISVKSVQESAPFPAFPANLNYPELSFNVIISYELTE